MIEHATVSMYGSFFVDAVRLKILKYASGELHFRRPFVRLLSAHILLLLKVLSFIEILTV